MLIDAPSRRSLRTKQLRQLGDVRRYPPRLVARVKLAQANNILAEIGKAIERRYSHIAGKCPRGVSRINQSQSPLPVQLAGQNIRSSRLRLMMSCVTLSAA
jgi:hypothetical protein